jgi:hypothetical protein
VVPIIVAVVVIAVVAAVIISRRKKTAGVVPPAAPATVAAPAPSPAPEPPPPEPLSIEDYFLIYGDGRLIHHDSRRLKPEVDQEVLGGMFTAIQDFISKSFPTADGRIGTVKEIKYADSKILLEQGKHLYLAVVTEMVETTRLQKRMADVLRLIEGKCATELEAWDGSMDSVSEVKRLSRLILSEDPIPE